jgi:hypothetical protein
MYVAVNMYVNGIAIPEQFADYLRVLAGVERGRSSSRGVRARTGRIFDSLAGRHAAATWPDLLALCTTCIRVAVCQRIFADTHASGTLFTRLCTLHVLAGSGGH